MTISSILRGEYCTVYDVRSLYMKANETTDDTVLLKFIRQASKDIDDVSAKKFFPWVETLPFDTPCDRELVFGNWLSSLTTFTNGNGDAIASTEYKLLPYSKPPYYALRLKESTDIIWEYDSDNNSEGVISIAGVWGFARDGVAGWEDTDATLSANITTTGATSFTCTTGKVKAGMLLKIGSASEYIYAKSVTTGASDTVTCERTANGSTATTYSSGATIYRWTPGEDVAGLCAQAAMAYYKLRNNPAQESVTVDGVTFNTPKNIVAYIESELKRMGLLSLV